MMRFRMQYQTIARLTRAPLANAACVLLICTFLIGCAAPREQTKLLFARFGDSLRVQLDPNHSANWDGGDDSVVVNCTECYRKLNHLQLWFEDANRFYLSTVESPKFTFDIYHRSHLDTTYTVNADDLVDLEDTTTQVVFHHHQTTPTHHRTSTPSASTASDAPKHATPADNTTTSATTKKATTIRITANEGVAVYKDKSKREVIRILPKGATLPYLSREGDLYSVVIDGVEGFVESDAVQVSQ